MGTTVSAPADPDIPPIPHRGGTHPATRGLGGSTGEPVPVEWQTMMETVTRGLRAVAYAEVHTQGTSSQGGIGRTVDPKFDPWDGSAYTLRAWLRDATQSVVLLE